MEHIARMKKQRLEIRCVSSGTTHQGDPKYGRNVQCTAMATLASLYSSVIKNRSIFSVEDIDMILDYGDALYVELEPLIPQNIYPRYLNADEIPTEIRVGQNLVKIENMTNNWIQNGLYPIGQNNKDVAILTLKNILNRNVFTSSHNDNTDSILFTGLDYSVCFWRHNSLFYLFNSHAVNEYNKNCSEGVARLFEIQDIQALTQILINYNCKLDGSQYSMSRIRVVTHSLIENTSVFSTQELLSILEDLSRPPSDEFVDINTENVTVAPIQKSRSAIDDFTGSILAALIQTVDVSQCTETSPSIMDGFVLGSGPSDPVQTIQLSQCTETSPSIMDGFVSPSGPSGPVQASYVSLNQINNSTTIKSKDAQTKNENKNALKPVVVIEKIIDFKLSILKPVVVIEPLELNNTSSSTKRGRPKNGKKGMKYTKENAHFNAVKKYHLTKPQIHRASVKKYTENKPEVHRSAVNKYSKNHPNTNQKSVSRYNQMSRNVDLPLRRSRNLIAEKRDTELDSVKLMTLKKTRLDSPDVYVCAHCRTRLFDEEKSKTQWCCGSGANNVLNLAALSEDFYTHPAFEKRPRAYNNLFAFSALGVSHGFQQPQGLSFLKIQGRIYHRVFDLGYDRSINNIGLYISDSSERECLAVGLGLDLQVIRSITNFLYNVNPFIECFKRLSLEPSSEAFIKFEKTSRATHGNILGDQPVGTEVAAIICTDREQYTPRCIAIWKIGDRKPHTVDIMHPLYESFQFPLLYPEGNSGWFPGKLDNKGNKLTQARYVRCLLLSEDRFSVLGRLSEEWLVDMYCKISEERLRYLTQMQTQSRNNQLRSAPLQELLHDETIEGGVVPGRIYLPNSFTGGPRYMKVKYLDCIALVNRLGPPSYFITFTCNPNWPEIKQTVPSGQRANPLICARVFSLRLATLIRDIRSGLWFGKVEYLTYVIEFQKRGLPHSHICFRVEGGGPMQNLDIDKVCRADIPDASEADGRLRKAVVDHMIHGPCGPERDNLPCYDKEKRKCNKRFPKLETDFTFCDNKGFINLRRNSNNQAVIKYRDKEIVVNDLWVVPYNAALLLKYDAHINVEVSSQRSIVKYLFKYMTKGPDESRIALVTQETNEIEEYITKRYIGSSDAAWRVLEFDVTHREPNVKQLPVHLENQQTVYFRPNNINDALTRGGSDLITYFNRPPGENFDSLKYADFYEKFIVHSKRPTTKNTAILETGNGKFITSRQRGENVARLFWVAPNRGEQFYLRLLLNSFACRSYADLLAVGGPNCSTFQEAAKAVGLADDEVEYERAMLEAASFFTGHRLRRFFVLLAVNGIPVASLWDTFKKQLSEDNLHRSPHDEEQAYNLCLTQINNLLRKHSRCLSDFGLPNPNTIEQSTELIRERTEIDLNAQKAFVDEWLPKLSSEQNEIFNHVDRLYKNSSLSTESRSLFIDGPSGTGKTLLLNVIAAHVRGNLNGVVLATASSAIAAQNHKGGVTAHSMFKYPLDIVDDCGYWNITNKTQRAELIYHADVIIYDEAPMAHKFLIHLLDRSLRDLMKSNQKFGGKIVIFAGDFRQIPPVVVNARTNSDILNSSVKTSPIWQQLKTFRLLNSQRCKDDPEYADFLLKLGSNTLPLETMQLGSRSIRLVSLESIIEYVSELDELIEFVYPFAVRDKPDVCAHRAILGTRNDVVRQINSVILERVSGEMRHFYSIDKVESENADQLFLGPDALNRLQPPGIPEFDLKLKKGCVCMVIRNISFADGLINGSKVIVVNMSPRLITVRKPGGLEEYLIPRILFNAPVDKNSPFEMIRRQFPLQVCYAMTIHKSQGQTINRVGVDLRSDVFSHGQLYVALGRVRERRNIKILLHGERILNGKPYTNNVVIPELIM